MKVRMDPAIKADESFFCHQLISEDVIQEVTPVYSFSFFYKNVYAKGIDLEGGFLILKGSEAALYGNSKLRSYHKKLRKALIENGVLMAKDHSLEFAVPYLFKNEYEATCVVAGNTNCRIHSGVWIDEYGKTPLENRLIGITKLEMNAGL